MLSVVVPIYNEEKVIPQLLDRIKKCSGQWGEHEVIFVDDGSADGSFQLLERQLTANPSFRLIKFSRNFGHQMAVSAGLKHARGESVAVMDGDLQDPPELIEKFLSLWRAGNKIVYAIRARRKENIFKRIAYRTFYRLLRYLSDIDIPLDAGDFCLMDRRVVDVINNLPEINRFIRGLRSWSGFKACGVPYERDQRAAGESKYTLKKLMALALDGIINFSILPLRFAVYLGVFISIISLALAVGLVVWDFASPVYRANSLLFIALAIFFMGGVQLFVSGVIGEYIGRVYFQVQGRPLYIIESVKGFD